MCIGSRALLVQFNQTVDELNHDWSRDRDQGDVEYNGNLEFILSEFQCDSD